MPELPIVAEISNWGMFILGAALIAVAVASVPVAWRLPGRKRLAGFAGLLIPLVLGLIPLLRDIGWQLRIDQNGIALHGPLEPFWQSGEIAWPDLTDVSIVTYGNRGPHYVLSIRGQRGVELLIASAAHMPPQFIAQLQAVVARFAPQVTGIKDLDRRFQYAREHSDGDVIYNSYSVRDGRGVRLR